jgi:CDP-diacylglycerol pyrophosphatase
VVALTTFAT